MDFREAQTIPRDDYFALFFYYNLDKTVLF